MESAAPVVADAAVLATGGLVGGGIRWVAPQVSTWDREIVGPDAFGARHLERRGSGFVAAAEAPLAVSTGRLPPSMAGAPEGALFETFAWAGGAEPAGFERVGIWTSPRGNARDGDGTPIPWLYCAGDAVAGAPRTMLCAVRSGLAAGLAAATPSR
jgi:hypothetical protein